jgi:hypothetical protein
MRASVPAADDGSVCDGRAAAAVLCCGGFLRAADDYVVRNDALRFGRAATEHCMYLDRCGSEDVQGSGNCQPLLGLNN